MMADGARQPGNRIRVVGTSGSGKTTLARRLAARLGIPHIELDALHWEPGWTMAEPDVFGDRIAKASSSTSWVMDGNYSSTSVRVVPWGAVDTLIFLDYSLPVILKRIIMRSLRRAVTGVELWNGNRERWQDMFSRDSIILWSLTTYRRRRRQYRVLLNNPEVAHLTIIHLHSPRETERWLRQVTPRGIRHEEPSTQEP